MRIVPAVLGLLVCAAPALAATYQLDVYRKSDAAIVFWVLYDDADEDGLVSLDEVMASSGHTDGAYFDRLIQVPASDGVADGTGPVWIFESSTVSGSVETEAGLYDYELRVLSDAAG